MTVTAGVQLARADAVWIGPATGAPLINDVRITRMDADKLYFEVGGRETSRELAKVTRVSVDNESAFNAGEDAFAVEKYDAAVDAFARVIRASNGTVPARKAWMMAWSSRRLQDAAQKTGRFDAAVSAFIARVQLENPSAVPRPQLPDEKSTYLNTAATDLTSAVTNGAQLTDDQRAALLGFLIDVQRARHDQKSADAAADKLDEILAKDPTNPNAAKAIAHRHLQVAQAALDRKDFRGATMEIESNRAQFTDPEQQADALYLLAETRLQTILTARQQSPNSPLDANALKDAALAYMRVVAHFKDLPDHPHVAQSMMRAGQICELLNDRVQAKRVYEQVVSQYPDDPSVTAARQSIDRLQSAAAATSGPASQ